jgi:hypothetical protein
VIYRNVIYRMIKQAGDIEKMNGRVTKAEVLGSRMMNMQVLLQQWP